jgi:hypothetical protein
MTSGDVLTSAMATAAKDARMRTDTRARRIA